MTARSRSLATEFREEMSGEVVALCCVIFLADVVSGILAPTFSLYAQSLGISLAILGVLNAVGALSQLVLSLPLGILSDRVGRTPLLIGGLLAFVLLMLCFIAAHNAILLIVGRLLYGFAVVATFQIGAAHLGDISAPGRRAVAFGAYATAMGTGFTVGPVLGGGIADHSGVRLAYVIGAVIGVAGLLLAWRGVKSHGAAAVGEGRRAASLLSDLRRVMTQRDLLLVSFGGLLSSLTFAGAIMTFFPIYGDTLHLSGTAIGSMFAVRALVSAIGRLP